MGRPFFGRLLSGLLLLLFVGTGCAGFGAPAGPTPTAYPLPTLRADVAPVAEAEPEPTVPLSQLQQIEPEDPPVGADVEILVDDLDGPVDFAFANDGRLFYTEKATGNVRLVIDRQVSCQSRF